MPQKQMRHKNWVFTPMKRIFHTAISMYSLAHPDKKPAETLCLALLYAVGSTHSAKHLEDESELTSRRIDEPIMPSISRPVRK